MLDLTSLTKAMASLTAALKGPPLKPEQSFALREAFSDLPMRVDVVEARDLPAAWNIRARSL